MESASGVGSWIVPSWTVSGVAARAYASDFGWLIRGEWKHECLHPGGVLTPTLCGPIKQSLM